jgi:cell volume regulation protein A
MDPDASLILIAGGLLAAGVGASLVARRIRVPALVLFLGIGMAIGTDGLGWIDFADYAFARSLSTRAGWVPASGRSGLSSARRSRSP